MLAAATATFPPGYKLTETPPQPQNYTDPSGKEDGRQNIGLNFWVDGVDNAKTDSYFDAFKAWWNTHGWSVRTDSRPNDTFINAKRDEYGMSLETTRTAEKRISIGGSTPWVWPNGTPEPSR
ncbi:hypothetical protein [Amycolatopsis sp. CA-230715]|uniref:hypothetical protein n=1 Tax=Amycolatopsis sp. CA-230715 TaxID=2745196 RepID=UPI001C01B0F7|nr:hypothetical protein [Amycolatopsis sp. CA-230715]QWF79285.1 hypothetical protein HUW46_02692 [Amycolatopsis sp. CA-230715]